MGYINHRISADVTELERLQGSCRQVARQHDTNVAGFAYYLGAAEAIKALYGMNTPTPESLPYMIAEGYQAAKERELLLYPQGGEGNE